MNSDKRIGQYVIEMYRTCQYNSFGQAKREGGVYKTPVFWAEGNAKLNEGISGRMTMTILESCRMMDSDYSIFLRLRKLGGRKTLDTLEVREGKFTKPVHFY